MKENRQSIDIGHGLKWEVWDTEVKNPYGKGNLPAIGFSDHLSDKNSRPYRLYPVTQEGTLSIERAEIRKVSLNITKNNPLRKLPGLSKTTTSPTRLPEKVRSVLAERFANLMAGEGYHAHPGVVQAIHDGEHLLTAHRPPPLQEDPDYETIHTGQEIVVRERQANPEVEEALESILSGKTRQSPAAYRAGQNENRLIQDDLLGERNRLAEEALNEKGPEAAREVSDAIFNEGIAGLLDEARHNAQQSPAAVRASEAEAQRIAEETYHRAIDKILDTEGPEAAARYAAQYKKPEGGHAAKEEARRYKDNGEERSR